MPPGTGGKYLPMCRIRIARLAPRDLGHGANLHLPFAQVRIARGEADRLVDVGRRFGLALEPVIGERAPVVGAAALLLERQPVEDLERAGVFALHDVGHSEKIPSLAAARIEAEQLTEIV